MSFDLVKSHIAILKRDTELVKRLLNEHRDGLSVHKPGGMSYPSIKLEDYDRDFIIDTFDSFGTFINELTQSLEKIARTQFDDILSKLRSRFSILYDITLARQQEDQYRDDGEIFYYLHLFEEILLGLERLCIIANSLTSKSEKIKTYSDGEVKSMLKEIEKQKRSLRQKLYLKVDRDAKNLLEELIKPQNDEVLDRAFGKLLYLIGFDSEIYGRKLQADVDVVGISIHDENLVIVDTTTGSVSKAKIDQILGRKKEYEEFSSKLLKPHTSVYPVAVTSNGKPLSDSLGQREAMLNKVSVITNKELKELVELIKKGKMDPQSFIEYIQKKIPVST